jgi:hypothetical protein
MGFRTPMKDVNKDLSKARSETDSDLSLNRTKSTMLIEDNADPPSSEHLRCRRRMLVLEDMPPQEKMPPQEEKQINPSSTKSKEVNNNICHCNN